KARAVRDGVFSGFSEERQATTLPLPPASPDELSSSATSTSVSLSWTDNGGDLTTGFELWRQDGGSAYALLASPSESSYVDRGVSVAHSYHYKERAVGAGGASEYSSEIGVTIPKVGKLQVTPKSL